MSCESLCLALRELLTRRSLKQTYGLSRFREVLPVIVISRTLNRKCLGEYTSRCNKERGFRGRYPGGANSGCGVRRRSLCP